MRFASSIGSGKLKTREQSIGSRAWTSIGSRAWTSAVRLRSSAEHEILHRNIVGCAGKNRFLQLFKRTVVIFSLKAVINTAE